MILKNRSFERTLPSREAKKIYIFCEGIKREFDYFTYFQEIDSRINLIIYKLEADEDNSPAGLYKIACDSFIETEENLSPKYQLEDIDEVWIVFDTDVDRDNSRHDQIIEVRERCQEKDNWYTAQSNPCFEVWLYFHTTDTKPNLMGDINACRNWKGLVNDLISGGFNSRKHPINIESAISNSEKNFSHTNSLPHVGCTEMHILGKSIFNTLKDKISQLIIAPEPINPLRVSPENQQRINFD